MKSKRMKKREREAALFHLNSILARVRRDPVPEDIEDRMRGWQRLIEGHSPKECDECRRTAPADYNWLLHLEYAPIIDPEKARELEEPDERFLIRWGRGSLFTLIKRCEDCAGDAGNPAEPEHVGAE